MAQVRGNARSRLARHLGIRGRRGAVIAAAILVVALGAGGILLSPHPTSFEVNRVDAVQGPQGAPSGATPTTTAASEGDRTAVVHVDGAVANPGVYDVAGPSPRVRDVVAAAGGLAEDADTDTVNLAALVVDGGKVHIPHQGEMGPSSSPVGGSQSGPAVTTTGTLVNINTADASELDVLPGVGASTADAIVRDREDNGPFSTIEDLMRVSGIGERKFSKLRTYICV